jgi:putative phosphoesterase
MKIGILSDIHSEFQNFELALKILQREAVNEMICVGDVVEIGRGRGDLVVAHLQALEIPCVMGNHDQYSIGHQQWLLKNSDDPTLNGKLLKPETATYLQKLPDILRFTWEEKQVVVSHGTLWTLFPHMPARLFRGVLGMAEADILILGHTHKPMCVNVEGKWVVNPGSVSERGSHTCAILTLPEFSFSVFDVWTGEAIPIELIEYSVEEN